MFIWKGKSPKLSKINVYQKFRAKNLLIERNLTHRINNGCKTKKAGNSLEKPAFFLKIFVKINLCFAASSIGGESQYITR